MSDFEVRGRDWWCGVVAAAMTLLLWGVAADQVFLLRSGGGSG